MRRSHHALKPLQSASCARCSAPVKTHRVCDNCGYYGFEKGSGKKGMEVIQKDDF